MVTHIKSRGLNGSFLPMVAVKKICFWEASYALCYPKVLAQIRANQAVKTGMTCNLHESAHLSITAFLFRPVSHSNQQFHWPCKRFPRGDPCAGGMPNNNGGKHHGFCLQTWRLLLQLMFFFSFSGPEISAICEFHGFQFGEL